jgi:hypothetical protein
MTRHCLRAIAAIALLAQPAAAAPPPSSTGISAFASLAGGGAANGSDQDASRGGIFEAELGAGYELPDGFRPEVAVLIASAPRTYLGFRPGLRYTLGRLPFYARGALDLAAPGGSWRMRWLLGGAGADLRITDAIGIFGEADAGIPVASKAGFAFLFRGGAQFRF